MVRIQAAHALLPTGWARDIELSVARDGRIAAIGPQQQPDPEHVVPLLLPAPVNLHSHTFQRAMAGLTETRGADPCDSFWSWRKLMYRFLEHLTPDHVEAIAAQAFVEMAEAGYGAVAEFHYLHHGPGGQAYDNPGEMAVRIAAAAQDVGIGLTLLPVLYQHGGCDRRALAGGQLRFGTDLDPFAELFQASAASVAAGPADWRIGVAPHSLRAVDADGLDLAETLSGAGPIHIHVAEQQAEVDEVEAHMGARPVAWMLDRRDVSERWCLIHCTQMTADETTALAASGAVAGLCPITEQSLGDGIFDGVRYAGAGGVFGVGSDSNVEITLFNELKALDYSQRLRDRSRAALALPDRSTGRVLFDQAARGGAQAAHRDSGRIEVGAQADLIGLEIENPVACNRAGDQVLDTLIFGGRGQDCVRELWSAGRHIVTGGRHADRERIARRFLTTLAELEQAL